MKWFKGIFFGLLGMTIPILICWFMIITNKNSILYGNLYDNYEIGILVGILSLMFGFGFFINGAEFNLILKIKTNIPNKNNQTFKLKLNQNEINLNLAQKYLSDSGIKGMYNITCCWNYKFDNDNNGNIIVDFIEIEFNKAEGEQYVL